MTDLAPLGHSSERDKAALPEKTNKTRARQDTSLWEATLAAAEEDRQEGLFRNPCDFDAGDCRGCWKCWAASGVIAVKRIKRGQLTSRTDDGCSDAARRRLSCPWMWTACGSSSESHQWKEAQAASRRPGPAGTAARRMSWAGSMQSNGLAVGRSRDVECEPWRLAWLWFRFWLWLWLWTSGNAQVRTPSHTVGGFSALKCNDRKHPRVDDQQN
ncbi:hypothetical protein CSOJ01_04542 [Colletotrichum sojae]|uniref:Uncharacterized protein n=1 Tax=Colletotrichum sojae TaxID=2175907 RepID=A0A8H6JI67_9PEZI|nr:hypothetical protein CSOJ01_04542 [Colletotrichum sojae]